MYVYISWIEPTLGVSMVRQGSRPNLAEKKNLDESPTTMLIVAQVLGLGSKPNLAKKKILMNHPPTICR